MNSYTLLNGTTLTDEQLEAEAATFETGTWEGYLENIRVGRPDITPNETLVTVSVKIPETMLAAIDACATNRSDYIRRAVAAMLTDDGGTTTQ